MNTWRQAAQLSSGPEQQLVARPRASRAHQRSRHQQRRPGLPAARAAASSPGRTQPAAGLAAAAAGAGAAAFGSWESNSLDVEDFSRASMSNHFTLKPSSAPGATVSDYRLTPPNLALDSVRCWGSVAGPHSQSHPATPFPVRQCKCRHGAEPGTRGRSLAFGRMLLAVAAGRCSRAPGTPTRVSQS